MARSWQHGLACIGGMIETVAEGGRPEQALPSDHSRHHVIAYGGLKE